MNQKYPLMRNSVAIWLLDNTSLTFDQISDFTGIHPLEIQAIADGDVSENIKGQSPIDLKQLTREDINVCEENPLKTLQIRESINDNIQVKIRHKTKYTPITKRADKPSGVMFLLKYFLNISNSEIKKIIGTTNVMIESIRDKTYWNYKVTTPKDPVLLGLCSQFIYNNVIDEVLKKEGAIDNS